MKSMRMREGEEDHCAGHRPSGSLSCSSTSAHRWSPGIGLMKEKKNPIFIYQVYLVKLVFFLLFFCKLSSAHLFTAQFCSDKA